MSSGGSRWLGPSDPVKLREQLRQSETGTKDEVFETEVADEISNALAGYNDRDAEAIGKILDRIMQELGDDFEMSVNLRFGGSISKHTHVNGLSDVDALVLIHHADAATMSPTAIRKIFADRLRTRFGQDVVREGNIAVTLTVGGSEIQLIPAIAHGDGYKIPGRTGQAWSSIRPRVFSEQLTAANRLLNGKLVPTIKVAKAMMAKLPDQRQLSGYHTEVLAVQIFKGYAGEKTPKAMLRYLFDRLPDAVRLPRRDVTGQSVYLDEYLGPRDSSERRIAADAMDRIARSIRNADVARSVPMWRDLLQPD